MDVCIPSNDLNMKIKKMIDIVILVSMFVYFTTNEIGGKKGHACFKLFALSTMPLCLIRARLLD